MPSAGSHQPPKIATVYDIYFPDTGSSMSVRLSDLALHSGAGQPNETMIAAIAKREDREVKDQIQIDADCD